MDSLPAFAAVAVLLVVAPGPDFALVTGAVLGGGRRDGVLAALGIATGAAGWALAAVIGLAALLAAAPELLGGIRILGAAYLAWLGVRALLRPNRPTTAAGRRAGSWSSPYRAGMISNLFHPGQAVFYTSMLPQFIDPAADPTLQVMWLGAVFAAIVLGWFTLYALLASAVRIGRWRSASALLSRVTGLVLIGFAIRLAARL